MWCNQEWDVHRPAETLIAEPNATGNLYDSVVYLGVALD